MRFSDRHSKKQQFLAKPYLFILLSLRSWRFPKVLSIVTLTMQRICCVLGKALSGKAVALLTAMLVLLPTLGFWYLGRAGDPIPIHRPFEQFLLGSHRELSKLLLVVENLRYSNFKVIFDGTQYEINSVLLFARNYLRKNYNGEKAETWVKTYLYRSPHRGEVIYLKFPDGTRRPLRDVLLEELRDFPKSSSTFSTLDRSF